MRRDRLQALPFATLASGAPPLPPAAAAPRGSTWGLAGGGQCTQCRAELTPPTPLQAHLLPQSLAELGPGGREAKAPRRERLEACSSPQPQRQQAWLEGDGPSGCYV